MLDAPRQSVSIPALHRWRLSTKTRFLAGRSLVLLSAVCTFSVMASTELSINTLVGIKDAPKVGERFRIDAAGYNAAPVTLVCMEKSAYSALSGCELNANVRTRVIFGHW